MMQGDFFLSPLTIKNRPERKTLQTLGYHRVYSNEELAKNVHIIHQVNIEFFNAFFASLVLFFCPSCCLLSSQTGFISNCFDDLGMKIIGCWAASKLNFTHYFLIKFKKREGVEICM